MIVVSGCPRSGTSLMMDIIKTALGSDRILGEKFPQEEKLQRIGVQQPGESDVRFRARQYIEKRAHLKEKLERQIKEIKEMNPNGFWEMRYTVAGCYYRFHDLENLTKIKEAEKPFVCKIVSQGLLNTDPQYVDKIIFMLRRPGAVAKSQEKLQRSFPFDDQSGVTVHTPEMFINVTYSAARWLVQYPHVPVKIVDFDTLIEKPRETLQNVADFIGEGSWADAYKCIEPRLRRSVSREDQNDVWHEADTLYRLMLKEDYKEVLEYVQNKAKETRKKQHQMFCTRLDSYMTHTECAQCHSSPDFIRNKIKQAETDNIDWINEPCLFECAYDLERKEYVTIDDSIKNNHWLTVCRNNANSKPAHTEEPTITDLYEDIYR